MKIIVTGSLGNIGQPLTKELVEKGHAVTVISSQPAKQKDIEALGATAAIGTMEDVDFLATTFSGADAVYCMIPPAGFVEPDRVVHYRRVAANYVQAIQRSGVQRVIHLSSFGADLDKGTGIILGAHDAELILNKLPGTYITHMRPTYFYYNLYNFIGMIKTAGLMAANYGGDDKIVLVSPIDIAAAIADEITTPATDSRKVRYVASDERTANEIAGLIGVAIGKPDLKWEVISDEQMQAGMEAHGMPAILAAGLTEMYASHHSGAMAADYYRNKPAVMGKVKLEDFIKDFAAAFKQQ
jgi:uncharacterized protein YbjT (DUF2867 family)